MIPVVWVSVVLFSLSLAQGASTPDSLKSASAMISGSGLHWIDYTIVGLYIGGMLALGYYYSRVQSSTQEYFIGGRTINSFSIGISLFATLMSTVTYLSYPGEMMRHGPVVLAGLLSVPIAYFVVGYLLIPRYMKQRVTSAYQLAPRNEGSSSWRFHVYRAPSRLDVSLGIPRFKSAGRDLAPG